VLVGSALVERAMSWQDRLRLVVEQLVRATAGKLTAEAARARFATELEALHQGRLESRAAAHSAAEDAGAAVLALQRSQLEELRSLTSPPRIIRESLGLVYALLRPSEQVESVEHVSWDELVSLLPFSELNRRLEDFKGVSDMMLMTIPAVRSILDELPSLETLSSERAPTSKAAPARKTQAATAKGRCASGAVAHLLGGQVRGVGGTPRHGKIVGSSSDDLDRCDAGSASLLAVLRGESAFHIADVAPLSPPTGVLLGWAVSRLRRLAVELPPRQKEAEAERELARQKGDAERDLEKFSKAEDDLSAKMLALQEQIGQSDAGGSNGMSGGSSAEGVLRESYVRFSKGGAMLSSLAARAVAGLVETMRRTPILAIVVEGRVAADENAELAGRRAQAVAKYLRSQGIAASRLSAVALDPPAPESATQSPCVTFSEAVLLAPEDAVLFPACGDALVPEAKAALADAAAAMAEVPFLHLRVEGHTDAAPMWLGNMALSEGRANRVLNHLAELGVPKHRLTAAGCGEERPRDLGDEFVKDDGEEGRAADRRVVLQVLAAETAAAMRRSPPSGTHSAESLLPLALAASGLGPRLGPCLRHVAAGTLRNWGASWAGQLVKTAILAPEGTRPSTAGPAPSSFLPTTPARDGRPPLLGR